VPPESRPLVSIAIYTRNRAHLLYRALGSIISAAAPVAEHLEIAVSDGSDDDAAGDVVRKLLDSWPGGYRYVRNSPPLSIARNMNRAVEISTGEWVQMLGDDDYLPLGAGAAMIETVRRVQPDEHILIFGVTVVDATGRQRRRQSFRRERYLKPKDALHRLLSNSSWAREPAVLMRRTAFDQAGGFNDAVGLAPDPDMWVRLFSRYGVRCVPRQICALTIHEGAATTGMWNHGTVHHLRDIFDLAVASGVVPEYRVRRWQTDYFHQFILAGAYRRLRLLERARAKEILELFRMPEVRSLGVSPKWLPVRVAFTAATLGAGRAARSLPATPDGGNRTS
jgi:glycosyltransferase involved in cell wall biosynthesis